MIDAVKIFEVSGGAVGIDVVAQGAAAVANCPAQHFFDRFRERGDLL